MMHNEISKPNSGGCIGYIAITQAINWKVFLNISCLLYVPDTF